ncbi:hypothetical protein O181_083214 [Austropuccinia psidii MF-1]|uniref:DDE Tnp4 domain-containing protein n=1 Tax=Austropuccinia psidii MF-1 TaxID=1389203 RepID=A0A9Q3FR57_9BASI|nr:hypothetical protein [Austropuccinia psidii MF-1]
MGIHNDVQYNEKPDSTLGMMNGNMLGFFNIPFIPPPNDQWNSYVNQKGWKSIVFQCIVDDNGNFQNVDGGLPGSVHDSHMFRKSQIGKDLINGAAQFPPYCLLIRYLGYSEKLPILTPSRNQGDVNKIHSSTGSVITLK